MLRWMCTCDKTIKGKLRTSFIRIFIGFAPTEERELIWDGRACLVKNQPSKEKPGEKKSSSFLEFVLKGKRKRRGKPKRPKIKKT